MLDDEQQLVVVLGHADRPLRAEQLIQPQVLAVGQLAGQVAVDALLHGPCHRPAPATTSRMTSIARHSSSYPVLSGDSPTRMPSGGR